ncbi:hypothetical protein [Hwanghaeella sp.]|uniref:hypothetical protein n=1 Tax=Hwanghaeella sp. TaxID=2605943 RepID=UPI003CCB8B92
MKKLLLIIIPVLLLFGTAGGAAYYWFVLKDATEEPAEPEPPPPPPDPELVQLESLTIPVIRQGTVKKYILLKITLQVMDQDGKELANQVMPRIKEETYLSLHDYFSAAPLDQPISIVAIKRRLRKIAEKNIGSENLVDVLIEGIYEKRGS